jgi:hypothetical protein
MRQQGEHIAPLLFFYSTRCNIIHVPAEGALILLQKNYGKEKDNETIQVD